MRWSQAFIPTLRDDPADAEAASHRLLIRAGYVRQLMAGVYSLLPAAMRVRAKIRKIIEDELDAIGGQQFLAPVLHPAEIWRKSGRWDLVGDELFRLQDRKGADLVLGMTHEEIFTALAQEITSYRQLPQLWYHIQTKLRDEPRPKSGLLRVREFTMKDSYSFDLDAEGLDVQFENHRRAYLTIFSRLGLDAFAVDASSGVMGGSDSAELVVRADAGEDLIARCAECGYAANVERATSTVAEITDEPGPSEPEKFATPGVRTIEGLANFEGGAPADRQIKTLVYLVDGEPTIVLLRGDHPLQEQKLLDAMGTPDIRPADDGEMVEILGAGAGSLGAVSVSEVRIVADEALRGRTNMTTGANEDDFHLRGVAVERDVAVGEWHDLRQIAAGEPCTVCGHPLELFKAIELGHIFKLGTHYAEALSATVLDQHGKSRPIQMGSYGIGLERALAAVVEVHHDEKGITWPMSVTPWHVVITIVKSDDEATMAAAMRLYDGLRGKGVEVLLDDRDERPGVKFNDAELIGIPYRITVGPRGLADGGVEFTDRVTGETTSLAVVSAAEDVAAKVVIANS